MGHDWRLYLTQHRQASSLQAANPDEGGQSKERDSLCGVEEGLEGWIDEVGQGCLLQSASAI